MYLEVYPDVVFIINLIIDLILLFLLKKVNKKRISSVRIILAAATGSLFAVIVSVFPYMNYIIRFVSMYFVASLLMIVIAFGKLRIWDILKQWIVLNFITYFVGGAMNSLYYHTNLRIYLIDIGSGNFFSNLSVLYVIISFSVITIGFLFVLWLLRLYQLHKPLVYDVELVLENRNVRTKGLMDTGNCLYDPIHRKPIMVMENSLIDELLKPKTKQDMEIALNYMKGKSDELPLQGISDRDFRFSFIPYRTIGKTGMLLGIRLDKVLIHTDKESICNERITAAICENCLTSGKEKYHVILHKELL